MNYNKKEFALYLGEQICMVGTIAEIMEYTGFKRSYIHNIKSPSFKKKYGDSDTQYIVYEIEED